MVWLNLLPGDSRTFVDLKLLNDRRVTNYWDDRKLTGDWFGQHVTNEGGTVWDAYFLYGPQARWDQQPGPLVSSGRPVIGAADQLQQSIDPLLHA